MQFQIILMIFHNQHNNTIKTAQFIIFSSLFLPHDTRQILQGNVLHTLISMHCSFENLKEFLNVQIDGIDIRALTEKQITSLTRSKRLIVCVKRVLQDDGKEDFTSALTSCQTCHSSI